MLFGNAVIGQSGGPTAAINASLAGVIRGLFEAGCIGKIYGMRNGVEGLLQKRLIDLREAIKGEEDLLLLSHTPAAALGSCRKKLPEVESNDVVYKKLFSIFEEYGIRYFC